MQSPSYSARRAVEGLSQRPGTCEVPVCVHRTEGVLLPAIVLSGWPGRSPTLRVHVTSFWWSWGKWEGLRRRA